MIVVIGGTGFIGKNLLVALHASGRRALSVSRSPDQAFLNAYAPSIETMTILEFHADPAAALFDCTALVYLASTSTPGSNLETPWREIEENVAPLLKVLKAVQNYRPEAHCVLLSSGGTVYGQASGLENIPEETPLAPISAYGMGKRMMEAACEFMAAHHGLRTTILRPANPVGLWQKGRGQGIVGVLLRAAASGTDFPMQGTGSAVRDYFDVVDLCDAIVKVLNHPEKSAGQIFNVGSGSGRSVREIVDLVAWVTGRHIPAKPVPARPSDVNRVVLDTSRISATLGWRALRSLEDTIQKVWTAQKGETG